MSFEKTNVTALLQYTPCVTGAVSFVCSSQLLFQILKRRQKTMKRIKERLLVGMSLGDLFFSAACMLSSFFGPKYYTVYYNHIISVGNDASCNFQGFLYQLGIITPLYTACLCLYFYLTIFRNKHDSHWLKSKWEPALHIIIWSWAIITATIAVLSDTIFYMGFMGCFVTRPQPKLCNAHPEFCERLNSWMNPAIMANILTIPPAFISFVVIVTVIPTIYYRVRIVEHKAEKWSFPSKKSMHIRSSTRTPNRTVTTRTTNTSKDNSGAAVSHDETRADGKVGRVDHHRNGCDDNEETEEVDERTPQTMAEAAAAVAPIAAAEEEEKQEEELQRGEEERFHSESTAPSKTEKGYEVRESPKHEKVALQWETLGKGADGVLDEVEEDATEEPPKHSKVHFHHSIGATASSTVHEDALSMKEDPLSGHNNPPVQSEHRSSGVVTRFFNKTAPPPRVPSSRQNRRRGSLFLSVQSSASSNRVSDKITETGVLYVLGYMITYIPSLLAIFTYYPSYFLIFISALTLPFQGFWNWLIYTRGRMKMIWRNDPNNTTTKQAFWIAVTGR